MSETLSEKLRSAANGLDSFKTVKGDFGLADEAADEIDRLRAENARLRDVMIWAYDTLREINVSNYDHDDVCRLNEASVEVSLGIKAALQTEGGE